MNRSQRFKKSLLPLLIASVVSVSAPASVLAKTSDNTTSSYVTHVTTVAGWTGSEMEKKATQTGRDIVASLADAHQALMNGDQKLALKSLRKAGELNANVLTMMPFATIEEDMYNAKGKLASSETTHYINDLLPIYTQLDELQVYAPETAKRIRSHLKKSEDSAHRGKVKEAMTRLDDVMDELSATTVYMPVKFVGGQIKAAIGALDKSSPDQATANKAVNNALDSLSAYTSDVVATPSS